MKLRAHAKPVLLLVLAVTLFYSKVLIRRSVRIHWDAAGYYYPYQQYFADSIHAGKLPFWTSTLFSGFPFLADLQVGAWYPLNWPFFLVGITPRSMFWELWLHACIAALGAYLLAEWLTGNQRAAVLCGIIYSLSGYFVAHGEHIGLFQAASLFPLLLFLACEAIANASRRALGALVLTGGCLALAGHFQTVLYAFSGLGFWTVALVAGKRQLWRRAVAVLALAAVGALAVAAVQILPSAELLQHSLRARVNATDWSHGMLHWGSAATFLYPNALGVFTERYAGPPDISQHYFYAGLLLLPLAILGLRDRSLRRFAGWLAVPAAWYAIGPPGQLFKLAARLPGFSSVRAPNHIMFVVTLALALAGAAGAHRVAARFRRGWIVPALCLLFWCDLWYWNMARTRLLYDRGSFEEVAAPAARWFADMVRPPLPPMQRLAAPGRWEYFDPAAAPFRFHVETTFGSNALMLSRYYEYLVALNENPTLMSALGVGVYFDPKEWTTRKNPTVLPRFYFPPSLLIVGDERAAVHALKTVHAVKTGILVRPGQPALEVANDGGTAQVLAYGDQHYRLRVSGRGGMMRVAIPYYPGWHADIDGSPAPLTPMDHALMALAVGPGEHQVNLYFRSTYFLPGALISLCALGLSIAVLAGGLAALKPAHP